jgi:hypothetical protein
MTFHQFLSVSRKKPKLQEDFNLTMRQSKNTAKSSFCLICNDEARIINYGALSCYSCKTFFRRHSVRIKVCIIFFANQY